VDQLAELGFAGRFSPHFYGEPLLDPRLEALLAYARERLPRASLVVYTNGDALTPERARSLLAAGVDRFVVTFEDPQASRAFARTHAALPRRVRWRRFLVRHWDEGVTHRYNRGGTMIGVGSGSRPARACQAPAVALVVDAWGKVKLCANDYAGRHDLGDLSTTPLRAIWEDPEVVRTRRELLAGIFRRRICQVCSGRAEPDATRDGVT
jgi:8-amino-3,8-dideoxy-alpha-D-manno-octulosonate transaminase